MLTDPIALRNKLPKIWKTLSVRSLAIVVLAGLAQLSLLGQKASVVAANDENLVNAPEVAITQKTSGVISGTVLDTNGNVIRGARVVLTSPAGTGERVLQAGPKGNTRSPVPAGL